MYQSDGAGTQLSPETVLRTVADAEEKLWGQSGGVVEVNYQNRQSSSLELGVAVIQHGAAVKRVHNYFKNLEQRKCCLLLAACKQTFDCVRLVRSDGRDSGIEEGAMMMSAFGITDTVPSLDAVDFQVFQHAYVCALFPVLGAPDPPTGVTPSPGLNPPTTDSSVRWQHRSMMMVTRATSPFSLHDSGIEEQEDTSCVPSETLCELLRRAFRLSPEKFLQYENIIAGHMDKKSPQKILAEELVRQLVALENNSNPFYSPKTFVNRLGYDQWQQRERTHITDLIHKFWHFSLPQPSSSSLGLLSVLSQTHREYVLLMERLIRYESPYRRESELISPHPTSPLSSASVRLLKEFGLRYGVGEQFRKIVYLHYLAVNFDPSVWFIQHVMSSLAAVMELLPSKRSYLIIVKEEYLKLETCLQLLEAKASGAIIKMKTLFPSNKPADGVDSLIELLYLTLQAKSYLLMQPEETLGLKLQKIVHAIFPTAYERHKLVAKDELRQNKWTVDLNPKLLNMLIGKIRDEIQDYRQNYHSTFSRYFNITMEAAQEFYMLLMADVSELQKQSQDNLIRIEIDLLKLSLAYRLNQLDADWSRFLTPQMQTWRDTFLPEVLHWGVVMKVHMQDILTLIISLDKYRSCELQLTGVILSSSSGDTGPKVPGSHRSLTPSVNSAFSSLSSGQSTPGVHVASLGHPPVIEESSPVDIVQSEVPTKTGKIFTPVKERLDCPSLSASTEKRSSSDPITISGSSLFSESYLAETMRSMGHYDDSAFLSFAHLRHSSSLPNIRSVNASHKYIEMETHRAATNIKVSVLPQKSQAVVPDHAISPEITKLTSEPKQVADGFCSDDDSDERTLTDESETEEEDFSFPPLQEVSATMSGSPGNTDCKPVTVGADNTGSTTILRPTAISAKRGNADQNNSRRMNQSKSDHEDNEITVPKLNLSSTSESSGHPAFSHDSSAGSSMGQPHHEPMHDFAESLTDSLQTNVSFPQPSGQSSASVPLSSSLVDVIVILQRLIGIGKTLCNTLSPLQGSYDSESSTLPSSDEDLHFRPPVDSACRQKLYDTFLNCICNTVCTYADNMMCMDLCGTTSKTAQRLAGPKMIEYLRTQQESGIIWGCRHDVTGQKNCFLYLNRRTQLLCDRHEPITREMCTRINNVMCVLSSLDVYHRRLGHAFGICSDWSVRQRQQGTSLLTSLNSTELIRSEFIVVEEYSYDPKSDSADVFETASQRCPSSLAGSQSSNPRSVLVSSPVDPYRNHLMAVLRAQCRIMAYRLNLFVQDALPLLLALTRPQVPLAVGLKPITDFLANYITALKHWLYKDSFRRVLECLWIFIVQDFELELRKIEDSNKDGSTSSRLLLQALAHFLKFMNSQHECLRKELLLAEAEDVSFKLSLHASPTSHLTSIYAGLLKDNLQTTTSSMDSQYQTVMVIRQRIKQDLQTFRKCFSGADLVRWILNHNDLFVNFDPALSESGVQFSRETAYHVAQRLLDWGLIADVEGCTNSGSRSRTNSLESLEFPDLTIVHQYPHMGGARERNYSIGSDDSTPQATPRATPRPNLKASIRAASRLSSMKQSTRSKASVFGVASEILQASHSGATGTSDNKPESQTTVTVVDVHATVGPVHINGDLEVKQKGHDDSSRDLSLSCDSQSVDQNGNTETTNDTAGETKHQACVSDDVKEKGSQRKERDFTSSQKSEKGFHGMHGQEHEHFREFDPYLRVTPTSLRSAMSSSSTTVMFMESSDTFYYVCPLVSSVLESKTIDFEQLQLVEECFQKRVSPDYLMKILYSRRKSDVIARNFVKNSSALVDRIKYQLGDGSPVCVSQ